MSEPKHAPGSWFRGTSQLDPAEYGYDGTIWIAPEDPATPDAEPYMVAEGVRDEGHARLITASPRMLDAIEATLLFHSCDWNDAKVARWDELTGGIDSTAKSLCDFLREVRGEALGEEP